MKTIRLLPNNVPKLWPAIKFAAVAVDRIPEMDVPLYLNQLLIALMNDKAQCFVRMDEDRNLTGIAITRLTKDEVTDEKSLFINCLYSFEGVSSEQWKADVNEIVQFAKANGCKKLAMYSNNQRVFEIVSDIGFSERFRCFSMELED